MSLTRFLVAAACLAGISSELAAESPIRSGFDSASLPGMDDGSSTAQPLGFTVDFFGQTFSSVFVNSNGNVTFGAPLSDFTPVPLGQLNSMVIAPFFADVDTTFRGIIQYGTGTVDRRPAFAATWRGVDFYGGRGNLLNDFQLLLIDRSDTGRGNFDVEFNYAQVVWESGDFNGGVAGRGGSSARIGFTNGTAAPGTFYELPGSGIPGAFLDNGPGETALILNSLNSDQLGRYRFFGRDGVLTSRQPDGGNSPPEMESPTPGPRPGPEGIGAAEPGTLTLAGLGGALLALLRLSRQNLASFGLTAGFRFG
jgi:hypothetical protein